MAMLVEAFHPRLRADNSPPPAWDDFWYQDPYSYLMGRGGGTVGLTAETIFYCGTVLAAVRFLADAFAMCPPHVIRELPGDRRERDRDHYLHRVLRTPNAWQSSYRWRHQNMVWAVTWGNSYNRLVGGRESFVEELRPIHPSRLRVSAQNPDGTLQYKYKLDSGLEETLRQDDLLHFRGISTDSFQGMPIYQLIRNVVGIALLAERHATTFLRKGARVAGLLVPSTPLEESDRVLLRDTVNRDMGGPSTPAGTFAVLPYGVDMKPISNTNREAQFAELSDGVVGTILRFLGVPGVVVGYMGDKTATYASADAFFEKGGIKHCLQPWVENFEDELEFALLLDGDPHQVKFSMEVLLRANTRDLYAALFQATGRPWMTGNEARRIIDFNPAEQEDMDEVANPVNMTGAAPTPAEEPTPRPALPAPEPKPDDEEEEDEAAAAIARRALAALARAERRNEHFARQRAAQIVRREKAAILGVKGSNGAAARFARDPEKFKGWAWDYYEEHVAHVMEALELDEKEARAYCARQRESLVSGGVKAVETWEKTVVPQLAALALGESA